MSGGLHNRGGSEEWRGPIAGIDSGDTAFMILATTFVFIQTPAMGIAQAGLLRRKNVLSMITQTMIGVCVGSLLYAAVGFSLFWGDSQGGIIGSPTTYPFLFGVSLTDPVSSTNQIPQMVFCAFQMMFALMTPVIVTGAWAEKFSLMGFLSFVIVWPLLVYYPLAHWLWHKDGWMAKWGVEDFAGGMVIHTSTGVSGLVVSAMLQHRRYMESASKVHHNIPLFATGSFLIWAGWYFFNGGSAYNAGPQAATAMMNTHLAACSGSFAWMWLSYYEDRKFRLGYFVNGALAGLGGITAISGFTCPQGAMVTGCTAGLAAYKASIWVQQSDYFDDVLDCFALQGVPGMIGSIMIGIFGDPHVDGTPSTNKGLIFSGDASLLGKQITAVVVTTVYSAVWTYVLIFLMKKFMVCEINDVEDAVGLDLSQVGEPGYDGNLFDDQDRMLLADKLCSAIDSGDWKTIIYLKENVYDVMPGMSINEHNRAGRTAFHAVANLKAGLFWSENKELRNELHRQFHHLPGVESRCKWLSDNSEAIKVVTMLLEGRACINEADNFKRTPLQYAMDAQQCSTRSKDHQEELTAMIEYLRRRGAITNPDAAISRLNSATMACDVKQLTILLSQPGVIDLADYDNRTALHVACDEWICEVLRCGSLNEDRKHVLCYLLQSGANRYLRDRWGNTVVDDAENACQQSVKDRREESITSSLKELQQLLNNPEDVTAEAFDPMALSRLVSNNNMSRSKCPHCQHSISINDDHSSLINTSLINDQSKVPLLIDTTLDTAGYSQALSYAASPDGFLPLKRLGWLTHHYEAVRDDHGLTLLHVAAYHGHLNIVEFLITTKGVNAVALLDARDDHGNTPYFTAVTACHGHDRIARLLRDRYRELHDDQEWPNDEKLGFCLCLAAKEGDKQLLNDFRIGGAPLGDHDYDNRTALHLAVNEGHVSLVEWLLIHDTKLRALRTSDRKGNTPLNDAELIMLYQRRRIRAREHGAKDAYKQARLIYNRLKAALSSPVDMKRSLCTLTPHFDNHVDFPVLGAPLDDHPFRPIHSRVGVDGQSGMSTTGMSSIGTGGDEATRALVQQMVQAELDRLGITVDKLH